jgi:hypothetical protein
VALTHIPGGPCYRSAAALAVDADGAPLACTADGVRHRLSGAEQQLLQHCADFVPAERLQSLPGFRAGDLQRLEAAGLLESDAAILRRCAAGAHGVELAPIADLAILTCAAPALLERAITSWTSYARRHGRELHVLVVDDSPTAAQADEQRAAAAQVEHSLGIRIRFVDPRRRADIAAELARLAGVDAQLTNFALAGCPQPRVGIGGNRNLIALLTQGRRVLSADDDILAEFEQPPPGPVALWLATEAGPLDTEYFASPQALAAQVRASQEPDAFALHEAFVGHPVANVVARLDGAASLQGAQAPLLAALGRPETRIAASALGLAGDSASDCLAFYSLLSTGESAQSFFAQPPLSRSREVLRRHRFAVLNQGVYFMTYCHAVDNTLPLPPYFPVGRGEDQVWQKLLHACLPQSVVANLPLAASHRPLAARQYRQGDYLDPCRSFPGNAFMLGVLSTWPGSPQARDEERLGALSRHLAFLAESPQRFAELLRGAWRAYLQHHHVLVSQALAGLTNRPHWWQVNMKRILARLEEQLREDRAVPLEYAAHEGTVAAQALRRDLALFAALLQAWPPLRRGAAELSARLRNDPDWLRL